MKRPHVNPKLERALLQHYGAQNRTHLFLFGLCFIVAVCVAAWVMITRPDHILFNGPVVALGIPAAIGAVVFDVLLIMSRRQHLLEMLRAGTQIRRVWRADQGAVINANPALVIELVDGRMSTLQSSDDKQLARMEKLLRVQMEIAR